MIELWGLKIHGYGLMIGLGIWLAWEVALRFGKVKSEIIERLALPTIFWGIVGARAYHVIDLWEYYRSDLVKIFFLWNGGLGIWGAILGGLAYLAYFSRKSKTNFFELSDSIVIGLPLAQAVGRVGNFINGELYGKNGEPLFAWEGGLNIILFFILLYVSGFRIKSGMTTNVDGLPQSTKRLSNDGVTTGIYLIGYGIVRIVLENFRSEQIIWRAGGVPVAIWFGWISVVIGASLFFKKEKTSL